MARGFVSSVPPKATSQLPLSGLPGAARTFSVRPATRRLPGILLQGAACIRMGCSRLMIRRGSADLSFGYIDDYVDGYADILEREYGVELDWVAACVVNPRLVAEVSGYNSIMMPAIERKFGKGILSQIEKRAIAGYEPVRRLPYDYFSAKL